MKLDIIKYDRVNDRICSDPLHKRSLFNSVAFRPIFDIDNKHRGEFVFVAVITYDFFVKF